MNGIRQATPRDVPAIYALSLELHRLSRYRDIPPDEVKIKRLIAYAVATPGQFAWVSEKNGRLNGIFLGFVDEIMWSREKEAHDAWFYSKGGGNGFRLMQRFIDWASERNVVLYGLSISSGINDSRTEALFGKLGLEKHGSFWGVIKGVDDNE